MRRQIDDPLSTMLLDGRLHRGQQVAVGTRDGQLSFDVQEQAGVWPGGVAGSQAVSAATTSPAARSPACTAPST